MFLNKIKNQGAAATSMADVAKAKMDQEKIEKSRKEAEAFLNAEMTKDKKAEDDAKKTE